MLGDVLRLALGGCVCIRNPGAAFTSTIAPPVSRTGSVMSGARKSIPATSSPTTRAASSAISTLSSCASHVRSIEMPPGRHVAGGDEHDRTSPRAGRRPSRTPAACTSAIAAVVDPDPRQHLLVADPATGVLVRDLDELAHGVLAVADHVRRHPLGDRDHPAADHEHPVVAARDEGLDDHAARRATP